MCVCVYLAYFWDEKRLVGILSWHVPWIEFKLLGMVANNFTHWVISHHHCINHQSLFENDQFNNCNNDNFIQAWRIERKDQKGKCVLSNFTMRISSNIFWSYPTTVSTTPPYPYTIYCFLYCKNHLVKFLLPKYSGVKHILEGVTLLKKANPPFSDIYQLPIVLQLGVWPCT